ncbi:MAG: hypothetical protein P4L68_08095 [Methylovirgula sp.]|nr:hypothetical protein [Methylovirgula sp.]
MKSAVILPFSPRDPEPIGSHPAPPAFAGLAPAQERGPDRDFPLDPIRTATPDRIYHVKIDTWTDDELRDARSLTRLTRTALRAEIVITRAALAIGAVAMLIMLARAAAACARNGWL